MGKNLFDLRFVIEGDEGFCSSQWRLWITSPGDVYLTTRSMGGVKKYSFHQSGICRDAFTTEYGVPKTMADRAISRWKRAQTPLAGGGGASSVALIAFTTDFLSRSTTQTKKTNKKNTAQTGGATNLEKAFTFESEAFVLSAFQGNHRRLHSYTMLPSGESFIFFLFFCVLLFFV